MKYGFLVGAPRFNHPNCKSLFLAALVPLVLFLVAECDDSDSGFRDDPRAAAQADGPTRDNAPEPETEEGKLPGRMHSDRTHGIWPQVWSQHAPSIQSWE